MDFINKGEIVFCNILLEYLENNKVKNLELNRVIFSRKYISNYPKLDNKDIIISKIKSKYIIKDIKVIDLDIIARTGYIHKHKGYTEVSKNNEVRNKITGAYE